MRAGTEVMGAGRLTRETNSVLSTSADVGSSRSYDRPEASPERYSEADAKFPPESEMAEIVLRECRSNPVTNHNGSAGSLLLLRMSSRISPKATAKAIRAPSQARFDETRFQE